ncbi:Glycosyltransferase [Hyphomicrobiales bacterium]|nr:Glycosyltransferase [Hyphomicrobiales bacterium]CAH1699071.1 Glycosyltransferase [Hyphomicrobiales bacterium]CAI0342861.1 Glycosyltransferase [Hyphomicrobiales bacterium]
MSATLLIAVTHLLGSGHLVRAANLARALARDGFAVTLASGGMPLRAMEREPFAFVQLPPVRTEGVDFRTLLDEAGQPIDVERKAQRVTLLEGLAAGLRPDAVIVEHFPFGRRQLAAEFLALIAAARVANPKVRVLSSVRDVLVTPRPERIAEANERLAELFDAVLVHGDAGFLPLDRSWPVDARLAARLRYTGYMAEAPAGVEPIENGEVLVSGGGSAAAIPLFEFAIAAAKLASPERRWRILVGRVVGEGEFTRLRDAAPAHVVVERARPDFQALLAGCAISISQAGYNTVLDLVAARRPAIVVPFDAGGETEQAVRAEAMERAGLARCLRISGERALTPAALAAAVTAGIGRKPPDIALALDGARNAATIVRQLLAERA